LVVTDDIDFGSSFDGAVIKLVAAKTPLKAVLSSRLKTCGLAPMNARWVHFRSAFG
jgi:hypothetical protein